MAAFAIKSSAVRWMLDNGIMSSSFGRDRVAEQRLTWLHMGELHRAFVNLDAVFTLPRYGKDRGGEIARSREIGAEMGATRILALQRSERNDPADFSE
jgi:hypothetical protein